MKSNTDVSRIKRGYLNNDFEYFHLTDKKSLEFEFHYHDFNKIIVFISGNVTYLIEGKTYKLRPWDILFVTSNDIHKAIIDPDEPYERIIIWVNSKFLDMHNRDESNLSRCFELSSERRESLLRIGSAEQKHIKNTLLSIEDASKDRDFGSSILKNSLFLQLMVYLNRLLLGTEEGSCRDDIQYDIRIEEILDYINANLDCSLSIENISSRYFINKYYLMHSFKEQTGYTLHSYIQQKRLSKASSLIKKGMQLSNVSLDCGFGDYSSFVRAFKKKFGTSPRDYYKTISSLENNYLGSAAAKEHKIT